MPAVSEPRVSGPKVASTVNRLGFIKEATDSAGEIWLLWNENSLKLQVIDDSWSLVLFTLRIRSGVCLLIM